ncbi:hypothetical protein TNCV_4192191 [Trichonephila clavipes]|nr:hypothetical protein TNCV_4192191 [Trichonephila clavipes]
MAPQDFAWTIKKTWHARHQEGRLPSSGDKMTPWIPLSGHKWFSTLDLGRILAKWKSIRKIEKQHSLRPGLWQFQSHAVQALQQCASYFRAPEWRPC